MTITENYDTTKSTNLSINNDLEDIIKRSFEFWHKKYNDSMLNYPLVWKKALKSDSEIIKKIEIWKKNSDQNIEIILDQFFEMWSYSIRKSNFEIAKKSMQDWEKFWKSITDEQFKMCSEILQMIEKYWTGIQIKNIE
jgi:hypothetical protein